MNALKLIDEDDSSMGSVPELISKSTFFSGLESSEIKKLANWFKAYSLTTGTFILKEGNGENCLCIIIEGEIDIYKETEPNKHLKVAVVKPNETIGEMGVIDGEPFSASAIAASDSIVLTITGDDFEKLIAQDEKLGVKLLRKIAVIISLRLRRTTGRLADLLANSTD